MAISKKMGTAGYTQNCEIWHGSSLGTFIMIQEDPFEGPGEDHVLALKGPYFGHFGKRGPWDILRIVKFGMEHPWAH